jgi:hypothetical protein
MSYYPPTSAGAPAPRNAWRGRAVLLMSVVVVVTLVAIGVAVFVV